MWTELTAADGHKLAAWRVGPAAPRAGLVVIQEIFGVNGHIRNVCARFAAEGYAVVAPALFDRVERGVEMGYSAEEVARGRGLRAQVPDDGTLADMEAAAAALPAGLPRGIVGYCWGGTVAWWGATRSGSFRAASGWYGGGIAATKDATPRCPVQLHFGETDHSIPMSDVEAIRAAQPGIELHVYPAGHGFGCDERAAHVPEQAAIAQRRTLEFLGRHLAA